MKNTIIQVFEICQICKTLRFIDLEYVKYVEHDYLGIQNTFNIQNAFKMKNTIIQVFETCQICKTLRFRD